MVQAQEQVSYLAIGQIVGPHGIRGEVKVQPLTDFPERFRAGNAVFLAESTGAVAARPMTMAAARPNRGQFLVKFAGIADRDAAEALRWQYILIPEAAAMPLGENENYLHDLMGLHVVTTAGQALGKIAEILLTPANDVYLVRGPLGEVLIPATREVIVRVDLPAATMTVALPDGLLAPVDGDADDGDDDGAGDPDGVV